MQKVFVFISIALSLSGFAWAAVPTATTSKASAVFPEGERLVYDKLLQSFHKNDMADMIKQKKVLEKNYPDSVYLGNAYFLIGASEFQQDHFGEALHAFDLVVNRFSLSPKRSAALYAMGATYKKLNLTKQASSVFERLIHVYPGSPEAKRASAELRLISAKR